MNSLTTLQQSLRPDFLNRDFRQVCDFFDKFGCNLQGQILERILADPHSDEVLRILDIGCASGNAIEGALRSAEIFQRSMGFKRKIHAIGVDVNPLDDLREDVRNHGLESGLTGERMAQIIRGDACSLPANSDSVDVLFSNDTLYYVADSLRALEEGYRVLRSGGVGYWHAPTGSLSVMPAFDDILEATPGGREVFDVLSFPGSSDAVVICSKGGEDCFKGFPFKVIKELKGSPVVGGSEVCSWTVHYRTAIYAAACAQGNDL